MSIISNKYKKMKGLKTRKKCLMRDLSLFHLSRQSQNLKEITLKQDYNLRVT